MAFDEDAAVMAILRFFSEHQASAVDGLAVLSVVAAASIVGRPLDQQAALLCGFKQAVSKNLASMQAKLDRAIGAGRLQ